MADVKIAMKATFGHEGKYSDNPNDPGGPTKWGVTEKVARAHGYQGDMKDYPIEEAEKVYATYWKPSWDGIRAQAVANELFDTEINTGGVADLIGQAALNSINRQGTLFPNMTTDGKLGPTGVQAINLIEAAGDTDILVKMLNHLQGAYYAACSAGGEAKQKYLDMLKATSCPGNEKAETFMRGWIRWRT